MRLKFNIIILSFIFSILPGLASAETIRVGAAEWKPWQINTNGKLSGITADLIEDLAERTDLTFKVVMLPHKRVMKAFENRQIDIEPTVNPGWRADQNHISSYTIPFYETADVILVQKGSGIKGKTASDFYGLSLGCGLGYYYPEGFQEALKSGDIIREDNPVSENNLVKLLLGRIDGTIMDSVQARYLVKVFKIPPDSFELAYQFRPSTLCFRIHNSKQHLLPSINAVIQRMKADGSIDRIVDRYIK